MGLLASDVDLALSRVEMSCVQKIILTKVDAGQVAKRQITNLQSGRTRRRLTVVKIFFKQDVL